MVRDPNAGSLPHQTPETIDDAPPLEDNLQENYETTHSTRSSATAHDTDDPHQQPQAFPPPQSHHDHDHQQPQAFPPPQSHHDHDHQQPQAFPPPRSHHDHDQQPQAFPPPQSHHDHDDQQPQAFPPPQSHHDHHQQPQAFPSPQDEHEHHQPQAFPPRQSQSHEAQAFPPPQEFQGAHAFPPQQNGEFQQQTTPQFPNSHFTNPAMNQPGPMPFNSPMPAGPFQPPLPTEPWKTDLFGCMDDPQNAIVTAFFPCVTFGQIAEIIDTGNSSCATSGMMYGCIAFLIAMPCILSCTYRTKLRARYGLMETPGPDWLVHCLCEWCALCQEYRELQMRGFDPAIGWQGNQARAQMMQLGSMTPPMRQNMMG